MLGKNIKKGGPNAKSDYIKPDPTEGNVTKEKGIAMPKNGTRKPGMAPNEKEGETYTKKGPKVLRKKYPANEEALKVHIMGELNKQRRKESIARGQDELKHKAYLKGEKS